MNASKTTVRPLARIEDGDTQVTVKEVETPKGERLELESAAHSIRLDAVALECLAWQTSESFEQLETDVSDSAVKVVPKSVAGDAITEATELVSITNEFAHVTVNKVVTDDGTSLELFAPKANYRVRLNAAALEVVTEQRSDVFSELIRRRIE